MSKEVSFKNHDRFIQLGVAISTLRRIRGLSQEKLAEKAGISRSLLSVIEAPNTAHCFSMEVFYNIADALEISPSDLLTASVFPDNIINKNKE
ncbi:MAG: helix-turn-helix domain-containing protein [Oscillospiraceae bacterium]